MFHNVPRKKPLYQQLPADSAAGPVNRSDEVRAPPHKGCAGLADYSGLANAGHATWHEAVIRLEKSPWM